MVSVHDTGGMAYSSQPGPADATQGSHAGRPRFDVLIVGAGLSGIGAAWRIQTERPGTVYAILEAREALGGTWDLFRYPGVRSDSDMYTLGYSFKPWRDHKALADGATILQYLQQTATESGIDKQIRFSTRVVSADFDTTTSRWSLRVRNGMTGDVETLTCSFLYCCSGYYDYEKPHAPEFAGIASFAGRIVHPQFWPEDLHSAGERVVVIGSGATAVTLVPALLEGDDAASHVTMLQRSPTWISPVPPVDRTAEQLKSALPPNVAHRVIRVKNIAFTTTFYQYCRRFPGSARRLLNRVAAGALNDPGLVPQHFNPTYDPWDQRLCASPGGDLYRVINDGRADMVTAHIDRFVPEGIRLRSGETLNADVIVTATGLRLLAMGGIEASVDGVKVDLTQQFVWNGAMITGLPNFALCIGYTNMSWTLRADLTHRLVCKVLTWMEQRGHDAVVPHSPDDLRPRPLLALAAGYIQRSVATLPHQGDRRPWLVRQNYLLDAFTTLRADLESTLRPVER